MRAKKTQRLSSLARKRKQRCVVQNMESSQRQLDIAARDDVFEAIRQGLDDAAHGRTRDAREVFLRMRRKYGIRR